MLFLLLAMLVPAAETAADQLRPPSVGGVLSFDGEPVQQVRIEERIIIRIPPAAARQPPPATEQSAARRPRERPAGKCLPLAGISGLRVEDDSSLVLVMRDRRMIRATLDRTCSAREFYSGFYVDRAADGQLCTDRDLLLSRSGATCSVVALGLLVSGK